MRIVIALGGNALLRRAEAPTVENQRRNVVTAAEAIAPLARDHDVVISHGNGPQVGLLALQSHAWDGGDGVPLDVLDAQTEGMIGYLIEQELEPRLPGERRCATLLTRVEVDADDPAFAAPSKPIGPTYPEAEARALARDRGWVVAPQDEGYRRVVPSPRPTRICGLDVIELLVDAGVVVICAGGGGIPTIRTETGSSRGVEAVIDKDLASGLLARSLAADALLLLTDVPGVYTDWPARKGLIRRAPPDALRALDLAGGSMGPKVRAAVEFVDATGGIAGIGSLEDASALLAGEAGTLVAGDADGVTLR